jgi:hypothetical protein
VTHGKTLLLIMSTLLSANASAHTNPSVQAIRCAALQPWSTLTGCQWTGVAAVETTGSAAAAVPILMLWATLVLATIAILGLHHRGRNKDKLEG